MALNPPQQPSSSSTTSKFYRNKSSYNKKSRDFTISKPVSFPILSDINKIDEDDESFISINCKKNNEFFGWNLYHQKEEYSKDSKTVTKVKALIEYFKRNKNIYDINEISEKFIFDLSIIHLLEDEQFNKDWVDFNQDLHDIPENTKSCVEFAMFQLLLNTVPKQLLNKHHILKTVRVKLLGNFAILNIADVKAQHYDTLITVSGRIIKFGTSQIICTWQTFKCESCDTQQVVQQIDGYVTFPISCKSCRSKTNFQPIFISSFNYTETFQTLSITDSQNNNLYSRKTQKVLEIDLIEDLVECVNFSEDVIVTGILKFRTNSNNFSSGEDTQSIYLKCVSIKSTKQDNQSNQSSSDITEEDLNDIITIKSHPDPFALLVHSLCPSIYGQDMVKAGLLLGLFGGSTNTNDRNETHILIIGDPGVGKSQILQACANVSNGIFVCGGQTTKSGLTVTISHEKGNGVVFEAGAVLLGDKGICCIDEFDKITADHQVLLEAMESQTVNIAKAGVLRSFSARTSILAVANPKGGHYNKSKTITENVNIGSALLSRFDLIFIIVDRPNQHWDNLVTNQLTQNHNKQIELTQRGKNLTEMPLNERLKLNKTENINILSSSKIKKYIDYARKNSRPKLTKEATDKMKEYYIELRKNSTLNESFPITIRQFYSLMRLSAARASIELCPLVTLKHVEDVLTIMKHGLIDVYNTDAEINGLTMKNTVGISQNAQIKKILHILQQISTVKQQKLFTVEELKEIAVQQGLQTNFLNLLDIINVKGYLLKKNSNTYEFCF